MASDNCTPVLDICNFEVPDWDRPELKSDIFENYSAPLGPWYFGTPFVPGIAENVYATATRYGNNGNSADERSIVNVTYLNINLPVVFDFPAALDLGAIDLSSRSTPLSVIDGYPAHLCFTGGNNNDFAIGGTFADEFYGGFGDDIFYGDDGNDLMVGGPGNDELYGEGDDDLIIGGTGQDKLYGGDGNDAIDGGDQDDRIYGGAGDDCIEGGYGNDRIMDMFGNNLIFGERAMFFDNGPSLRVEGDDEPIPGGLYNDVIHTGAGNDVIFGQWGDDKIKAGDGNNQVDGGIGNDRITTGSGEDKIKGGEGDDYIKAGAGDDEICADGGNDKVKAGAGNDLVEGGSGDDKLMGQKGDDVVLGGTGNDRIFGHNGDDVLAGQDGNDVMFGGNGNDTLFYGAGRDQGTGGAGDDYFKFDDEDGSIDYLGRNVIRDFSQDFDGGVDTIDFKCVEDLTHISVIALGEDKVRMIGYADEEGEVDPTFSNDEVIFDLFIYGENIGTVDSTEGILMQDSSYSSASGPVCANEGVLVDIGNRGDWDFVDIPGGGDDLFL